MHRRPPLDRTLATTSLALGLVLLLAPRAMAQVGGGGVGSPIDVTKPDRPRVEPGGEAGGVISKPLRKPVQPRS